MEIVSDQVLGHVGVTTYRSSGFTGSSFSARSARGTKSSPSALTQGDFLGSFSARGYGETGFSGSPPAARVGVVAAEDWTDTNNGTDMVLSTTPKGTTTLTERMRITSEGTVEMGGSFQVGKTAGETPEPGTIRFNPTFNDFEGWNGIAWVSLTGYQYEIGEVTDVEGNNYSTIKIGDLEWMATNLRTTKYRNGDPITLIGNDAAGEAAWITANYGAYCIYDTTGTGYPSFDVNKFGFLYNWHAIADTRNVCPTGWHVSTASDWSTFFSILGNPYGGKLKEAGLSHWDSPNTGATNESGFTGLPGGQRTSGSFVSIGSIGYWWLPEPALFPGTAYDRFLWSYSDEVDGGDSSLSGRIGKSVRCVKD